MSSSQTWSNNQHIIEQMILGSQGKLWGHKLEQSSHYPLLKHCLDTVCQEGLLIDMGCGAGDVSRVWRGEYLGIDLDWVIENVAKVCNPSMNYFSFDVNSQLSLSSLPSSNCILMNGFLDAQEKPADILNKVLDETMSNWIIVHRQKIGNFDTCTYGKSYGNSTIPISTMSIQTINNISKRAKSTTIFHWEGDYHSIILRLR